MIGDRIRARRRELGMTQEQLAAGLFDRSYISRIEANEVVPPLPTLQLLAGRLGKPVAYFLGDEDAFTRSRVIHDYVRRARRYAGRRRYAEAVESYRLALELLQHEDDSPLLLAVHVELAYALASGNRPDDASQHLFAALQLLPRVPLDRCPPGTAFRLHYTRGKLAFQREELAVAAEAFRLAAAAATRPADRVRAHVALGSTLFRQGAYEEAAAAYAVGLPGGLAGAGGTGPASATAASAGCAVEPAAPPDWTGPAGPPARTAPPPVALPVPVPVRGLPRSLVAACHHGLGCCCCALGRLDLAAYHLERAIRLYRGRDPERLLLAHHDLALVQIRQGAFRAGRRRLLDCLRAYRRAGRTDGIASALTDLASLELATGRYRRALTLARAARSQARKALQARLYLSAMEVEAQALAALDPATARTLDGVVRDLRALG
ncbi:helix-turn-helix transcriptional regulator [Thermaerobacter sp. PB12/4term]|uniref:helix-turn-helix domain-containing protein n=1 Tax=Thermaerobacter sp. PB12/4term TaxID=2293838 RepID=UPI000E32CF3D|nr:helix-turn-helix transcriptional regulator [Thermaerobacter sp. PB12/4term]QIA26559.1 helix-turn-helix transcriptional regulator [Thermaerobacter sp. PB12/4term]